MVDDLLVAHVGGVDFDAVAHVADVVEVAALIGQQAVEHRDLRADLDQTADEVAADKAEAAGDERRAPLVLAEKFRLVHDLGRESEKLRAATPDESRRRARLEPQPYEVERRAPDAPQGEK